jgi:hypothetical protein
MQMLVKIRNITYESVRHAADSLGVTKDAVYSALQRGTMDSVGLGNTQCQPIDLDGLKFNSLGSASVALGFNRSFVRYVLQSGSLVAIERLKQAIKRYKQERGMA